VCTLTNVPLQRWQIWPCLLAPLTAQWLFQALCHLFKVDQSAPISYNFLLDLFKRAKECRAERAPVLRLLHAWPGEVSANDMQVQLLHRGLPMEPHLDTNLRRFGGLVAADCVSTPVRPSRRVATIVK
jgi:hypothetical protein